MGFANAVIGADQGINSYLQTLARQKQQQQEQQIRQQQLQQMIQQALAQKRQQAVAGANTGGIQLPGGGQAQPPNGQPQQAAAPAQPPAGVGGSPGPAALGQPAMSPGPVSPPPPQPAPGPVAAGAGPQAAGGGQLDQFSPEHMVQIRGQLSDAIKQKNPDLDDGEISEATDKFVESLGKIRTLLAPSQQIIERQITTDAQGARQDKAIAATDDRQDKRLADQDARTDKVIASQDARTDRVIAGENGRQQRGIAAAGSRQSERLAHSDAQFQQREKDINDRLAKKTSQGQQNAAIRGKIQQIKAQRQQVLDQIKMAEKANGGLPPTDGPAGAAYKALGAKLDGIDAQMAKVSAAVGAEDPAPVPGAKKADDGNWYVPDPQRPGKYLKVG